MANSLAAEPEPFIEEFKGPDNREEEVTETLLRQNDTPHPSRPPRRRPRRVKRGTRHWSMEMEAIARCEIQRADGYAFMYEYMASSASRCSSIMSATAGIIGLVMGTTGFVSLFADNVDIPLWARIVSFVLGFVVAGLAVIDSTCRISASQIEAVLNQVSYATISRDIMCQLAQPRADRPDAVEYIRAKVSEIERLKLSAPAISRGARASYERKFKNNPIYSADQWGLVAAGADNARNEIATQNDTSESEGIGLSRTPSLGEIQALAEVYEAAQADEKENT
jgi:hypothetical protein